MRSKDWVWRRSNQRTHTSDRGGKGKAKHRGGAELRALSLQGGYRSDYHRGRRIADQKA